MPRPMKYWLVMLLNLLVLASAGCHEEEKKKETRTFRYEGPGGPIQVEIESND